MSALGQLMTYCQTIHKSYKKGGVVPRRIYASICPDELTKSHKHICMFYYFATLVCRRLLSLTFRRHKNTRILHIKCWQPCETMSLDRKNAIEQVFLKYPILSTTVNSLALGRSECDIENDIFFIMFHGLVSSVPIAIIPLWRHEMETFPRYWPFVRGIHRSMANSAHKGQWCGALMFSLTSAWINGWVNNREAGDSRRQRSHYNVIVMAHRWLPRGLTGDKSTLGQVMVWCRQATSHCLSHSWPRSMTPFGAPKPQWVNE